MTRAAGSVILDPDPNDAIRCSPTSVAVLRDLYALVAVDTSPSKKNASGALLLIDAATRTHGCVPGPRRPTRLDQGQVVSASACAAGGGVLGAMPQAPLGHPPGYLAVVETGGPPASWVRQEVPLTGLAALHRGGA